MHMRCTYYLLSHMLSYHRKSPEAAEAWVVQRGRPGDEALQFINVGTVQALSNATLASHAPTFYTASQQNGM